MNNLYLQISKIERLGRVYTERIFIKFVEQTIDFQTQTAKKTIGKSINQTSRNISKSTNYHIANYLSIAPKSLSWISKELFD